MSSPAGTPTRRLTRSLAKSLGTDSPSASPPVPASSLRRQVASQTSDSAEDASAIVVVERQGSPDVIVLEDSSADEREPPVVAGEEVEEEADDLVVVEKAEPAQEEAVAVSQQERPQPHEQQRESSDDEEESEDDESDSSSGSSSESESSEADSDDDDNEPPTLDDAALEALLNQAYIAADAQAQSSAAARADDEVVLQLEQKKDQPLPALSVPNLPSAYLSIQKDGRVSRGPQPPATDNAVASSSKLAPARQLELDTVALPAELSKKAQKAARKANAPLGWGDLPAIPDDRRKEMAREYHALRLRNALDPKRHYKGQGSSKAVPEVFAIGKLHEPSKLLQSSTLATASSTRPGSVITDILADSSGKAYAKRKFGDLQAQREKNGRRRTTKKPRH